MPSNPQRIGPFEIRRELGRGGMGEVHLAHDTRLDRQVAVKALPAHLADDAVRLARFQREAKLLASLNHPNIAAVHGLEEADGRQFLILEYIEGESLAARLTRGAIPVHEALPLARQITQALEAAHEKGIVHRDLKPPNVMITLDDTAKVLDFGLARVAESVQPGSGEVRPSGALTGVSPPPSSAAQVAASGSSGAASPTPLQADTMEGAIMGSPGYMSPEQARGRPVDKRSDNFSFGCLLYEMLTGSLPFAGADLHGMLDAIIHQEPDWARLPANTPERIRELLGNCLAKDRKNRLQDIGDARLTLERSIEHKEWLAEAREAGTPRAAPRLPWFIAASCLLVAAFATWRGWGPGHDASAPAWRPHALRCQLSELETPPVDQEDSIGLAISSDGRWIAYTSKDDERGVFIALRCLTEPQTRKMFVPVPVTLGITNLAFSMDGKWLAYTANSQLFKIPVDGGEPILLSSGPRFVHSKGVDWTADGILYSRAPNSGLSRIPEQGGEPETLTVPDASRDEVSHRYPCALPGGRSVLITVKKSGILSFDDAEIALLDLETKTWTTIIRGGAFARYVSSGHIVFGRNGAIMAVPFDLATEKVTGSPRVVLPNVRTDPGSGSSQFAIARETGTLVYIPGEASETALEMLWVGLDGKIEPVGAPVKNYGPLAPSRDGTRIASTVYGASDAIFVYDLARRTHTRMTFRGNCDVPAWTPDGSKIVFRTDQDGGFATYAVNADGSGQPERVLVYDPGDGGDIVSLGGELALVNDQGRDICLHRFGGTAPEKLVASQFNEEKPHVSPDMRWLSYTSDESGRYEIYVRPFPSGEGRWQVSKGGGYWNRWSSDGSALLYGDEEAHKVTKVSVRTDSGFEVGSPEPLLTLSAEFAMVEPSANRGRFVALRPLPRKIKADRVCAVLNWPEELKSKVPAGGE